MKKVMFDCNAFSSLLNSNADWVDFYNKCKNRYEFYITSVQIEELANISDNKRELRIEHLLCLSMMQAKIIPTIFVVDYSRIGFSIFADDKDDTYEKLLNPSLNNVNDALIGEAAKRENCILITNDAKFAKKLSLIGVETMSFESFQKTI